MTLIDLVVYIICVSGASFAGNIIAHTIYSKRDEKSRIRAIELENKFRNYPLEAQLKAERESFLNTLREFEKTIDRINAKNNNI